MIYYKKEKIVHILFILYGVFCAFFLVFPSVKFSNMEIENIFNYYMSTRITWMERYMASVGANTLPNFSGNTDHALGMYMYGSYLADTLGFSSYEIFNFFQMSAAMFLVTVYPLGNYLFLKSRLWSIISPVLVHFVFGAQLYMTKSDVHWGSVWCMVITFPALVWLWNTKWTKKSWLVYIGVCFVCSYANVFRIASSLNVQMVLLLIGIKHLAVGIKLKGKMTLKVAGGILLAVMISLLSSNLLGTAIPKGICTSNGQVLPNTQSTMAQYLHWFRGSGK